MTPHANRRSEDAALGRISWFRGAFEAVLGRPCERHGVEAGVPCWAVPRAACGSRIRKTGFGDGRGDEQ